MRSNLMDLIAERKKSKKPASSLAKETAPSPQSVASPPSTNAQRELQQVEPIPPGLFPAKISDEPSTNTSLAHEKSAPSHPASNFPDENQILGSKALNDGNDEPVPNLIRRGPPNSAYAIARKRAMESLARKGMDPKKGGVSMYNVGFILQPTYNGLFDPFTNDPMALIRGVFLEDGNSGPKSGKADAVEDPSRGMHQNATPQNGVQDDGRWFENTINKTPLPEFPVIASQQWAQQQMLREQQQLTRDQGLSESVLRQQQLARNSQFINVNVSANARQHEFLLLQQQQQQQRFQQQQQQYLGGTSHDEFPSAFTQEAQVRESQNQLRDLQVRERNAELLNSSVGSLGLKNASVGGWGGASAVGDYANDRWVWNAWSENSGAIWTDGYATAGGDSATRTGTNDEWYRADAGFMGARANAPSTTAAAAVGSSVPIIANAGGRSSGGGTAESVPELAHSRGNGSESLKADTGSVIEVTEIEGRKEIKHENGRQTMTNDGGKVDGKDATISSKGKTVVGYDPVVKKPKDVQTVTSITPQETAKEILSVAATTPPVAMTRKEKAKQRAKERELARQLQSERDLLAIREKEEAERKRLEVIVNDKDAKDDTVLSQQSASQSSQLAPETPIPTKSKKARQKSKKKQTSEINAKTEASISAQERESTAEEPLKSNVENSVAETIPEDGTSKKYSRRKRAKERDEKAKLLVPLESESHATNSSSSAAVENAMLPSASKAETIADLVKTPLYTSLMANMTEFSSKINQALRGEVDLESMVNGPFGQFLLGQADASNNPEPSTIDFSSPTEMTAGSISNALLAIADSFLKCAEASASQLASDAPLDGHLEFDESLQDVNAVDAAERFEVDEEASENADETLQVAGIDSYANILEKSVSIDMVRAPPVSNSSSKYINPFPMRHPNASDIEEDDEDNLCIEDGSSGFDYDFANLEEDAWESEPGLDACDADFEYGEKEESEYDVDLQTVDPDRSIAFLNQGAAYISELLESVHWMVEKGQNLIDSPPNVSPAVIELMATLEAENPWEPGKPVVPRRLPCQDLVDMLEQELEKCEEIRNGVERQLLDVIETNRNNAPELIEHFGLDPHVLEDICKIPGGVTASHSLPATVKFV
ncbi:hypothetical protein HDU82_001866 [Entophlyctis luteolus]|nr:hypothetical protein HDU82_001866 [Entophlyctis luteolus]